MNEESWHNERVFDIIIKDGAKYRLSLLPDTKLCVATTGIGVVDAMICYNEAISRGFFVELSWSGEFGVIHFHRDQMRCPKCGQVLP